MLTLLNRKLLCKVYSVDEKNSIHKKLTALCVEHQCIAKGTNHKTLEHIFWFNIYVKKKDWPGVKHIANC